ncbi:MAG TPA: long-chain fatty acid--CoA ligase [Spirochaetota bacterium]|nr:long-chain fatty acid--CoA ligase [Spirochaetota bacterium]HPP04633.1 long-chain fatty acid--CoA ligase [Spirochaetota bacterium]
MYDNLKTLIEVIYNSQKTFGDNDFLKYRESSNSPFKSITFNQFVEFMESMAASLYDLGVRKGDKVGIVSDNLYKWLIIDMAILSLGAADVPRGSDTHKNELAYILEHSDAKFCVVEDPEQADKVLSISENIKNIKDIILLTGDLKDIKNPNPNNIRFHHFDELLEKGKELRESLKDELKKIRDSVTENDLATIIYTSGTTGLPKGVMLLHKNIMQNLHAMPEVVPVVPGKERWLSVLPVWHVFERTVEYCVMITAGVLAYSKPVAKYLLPDLAEIKPTYMASVPRIWEALYNGIVANVKKGSAVKKIMFNFFISIGLIFTKAKRVFLGWNPLFKKEFFLIKFFKKVGALFVMFLLFGFDLLGNILIYSKIRDKTGNCLKGPISGGGALPEYIDNFFSTIKINILEGYGLTETSPIVGVRDYYRPVARTIGKPSPGVEVMIGDDNWNPLPNQHEKGVVYIKGDLVMAGYYKNKEKTDEVIKNGWLNTGDLGRLTITGELQLLGRAKDTIVLLGGENVEPAPIEDKLLEDPLISQVIVVGQDKKTLGALIVPAKENLEEFARLHGIHYSSFEELCKNRIIIDKFAKIIKHRISLQNGFRNFEKISCFELLPNPFEVGKELTASLKMKRNVIFEKYKDLIENMYRKMGN